MLIRDPVPQKLNRRVVAERGVAAIDHIDNLIAEILAARSEPA